MIFEANSGKTTWKKKMKSGGGRDGGYWTHE